MAAFCDLNVPYSADSHIMHRKLEMALQLGYEVVAINNTIEDLSSGKHKKKQTQSSGIEPPGHVKLAGHILANVQCKGRKLQQLSRISTVLTDVAQTHKLNSQEVQAYDIIAVQPTSEKLLQLACGTLDVDIISLALTERLPFFFKRSTVNQAIDRGIHFEICYSPAIRDSTQRKCIISNAHNLMNVCKGKGIIISSQSNKPFDLRGPYDVANLGLLFGLSEQQSKAAVSTNCRSVLMHARCRKSAGGVLQVMKASNLNPGESWKIKHCSNKDESMMGLTDDETSQPQEKKQKTS